MPQLNFRTTTNHAAVGRAVPATAPLSRLALAISRHAALYQACWIRILLLLSSLPGPT